MSFPNQSNKIKTAIRLPRKVTGDFTIEQSDACGMLLFTGTSNAVLKLPPAWNFQNGFNVPVKNNSSTTAIITFSGSVNSLYAGIGQNQEMTLTAYNGFWYADGVGTN